MTTSALALIPFPYWPPVNFSPVNCERRGAIGEAVESPPQHPARGAATTRMSTVFRLYEKSSYEEPSDAPSHNRVLVRFSSMG